MNEEPIPILEVVINELAFRSLNRVDAQSPDMVAAIDGLAEMVRRTGLGITAALCDLAQALREIETRPAEHA